MSALTPEKLHLACACYDERERTLTEAIQRIEAIDGDGSFKAGVTEAACAIRAMLWRGAA